MLVLDVKNLGSLEDIAKPTLNQWADECFGITGTYGLMNLAPNTIKNYRYKYDKFVRPWDFPLNLDRRTVQRFINTLSEPNDSKVLAIVSTLLTYAVDYDMLDRNVCSRIKTKRYIKPDRAWVPFSIVSATDYGHSRRPDAYNDAVRFLATTGMRYGEALALTAPDIDRAEQTGWLTIDKSIHGVTKSAKPRRVPYLGYGTVLPASRQFAECMKVHGPNFTIHSLRYTYAHLLKTRGIHPTVAQRLLGHSTITLTLGLYTGVLDEELEQARDSLLALG